MALFFAALLAADDLGDSEQTVTAGLDVGAVVTMLRALKRRCES